MRHGWVVSAYRIALEHGFAGTEREFRLALLGQDWTDDGMQLLVTDEDEDAIPEKTEIYMRPSPASCAYEVGGNTFLAADEGIPIPDGLDVTGRVVRLSCGGEAFGEGVTLPEASPALPAVTSADNGKILKVVSGKWAAGTA